MAAEASWLVARTRHADLVHHAGGTAPFAGRTPYVLTLHDLQPLEDRRVVGPGPRTHSALKRAYLAAVVPRSVRRARVVVVPSEFVRAGVIDRTGVDPTRVVVVPHAVECGVAGAPRSVLVDRYGLDGPVVLYPAITYPHKDHATLVEAFATVLVEHPSAVLVLPGRADAAEADLTAQVDRLGIASRVRRIGRVPAADLVGLYRLATVVAVPSVYEGFGLPAAEAMAHGVPVVAADSTSLPEVVGDAGLLVAPGDAAGFATAISEVLAGPGSRARLAAAGLSRVSRFSRSANADALLRAYRIALA